MSTSDIETHRPALFRRALHLMGNDHADAEDLVQDTIVGALQDWGSYEEKQLLRSWLFQRLRWTYSNRLVTWRIMRTGGGGKNTSEYKQTLLGLDKAENVGVPSNQEACVLLNEMKVRMKEAHTRESPDILLKHIFGIDVHQIAAESGLNTIAVCARLSRTRRSLKLFSEGAKE